MSDAPRIGLPLISANQSQKEVTHNESLIILDALHGGVLSRTTTAPPATPTEGDAYIVPGGATGDWQGHTDEIAYYFGSVWNFLPATSASGLPVYVVDDDNYVKWYLGSPNTYVVVAFGAATVSNFTDLDDAPTSYTGHALKGVRVNSAETALEFYDRDEVVQELGSISGAVAVNLSSGQYIRATIAGDVTFSFTGDPAEGFARGLTFDLDNPGGSPTFVVTWPAAVLWAAGTEPTLTAGGRDLIVLAAVNGTGAPFYVGALAVSNMS